MSELLVFHLRSLTGPNRSHIVLSTWTGFSCLKARRRKITRKDKPQVKSFEANTHYCAAFGSVFVTSKREARENCRGEKRSCIFILNRVSSENLMYSNKHNPTEVVRSSMSTENISVQVTAPNNMVQHQRYSRFDSTDWSRR